MFSDGYLGLSLRAGSSYRASDLVLWPFSTFLSLKTHFRSRRCSGLLIPTLRLSQCDPCAGIEIMNDTVGPANDLGSVRITKCALTFLLLLCFPCVNLW